MPRDRKGQPVRAAPGQQYGERKQQEQAQQEIPLPAGLPSSQGLQVSAEGFNPEVVGLSAPPSSEMPITSGLPIGPGPGPEAVPQVPQPTGPSVEALMVAKILPMLTAMSARNELSPSTVQFIRKARQQLGPQFMYQFPDLPPKREEE